MKNIYNKVHISFFFYILIFISLISGLFRDIIWLLVVLLVHEMGHILLSKIFNWQIDRIDINVYGGLITYKENIDKPFLEEFIISISGIVFQSLFYFLILFLYYKNLVDSSTYMHVKNYHLSILIFNLLPIIPLDGSKMVSIFLNIFFSYKRSLYISLYISFTFLALVLLGMKFLSVEMEFSYISILAFILHKLYEYKEDIRYCLNKFLFERYTSNRLYKNANIIYGYHPTNMKRQKNNVFFIRNRYYPERKILELLFSYL